jgi:hypothetical protein
MDIGSALLVKLYSSRQEPIAQALRMVLYPQDRQLPGEMRQLLAAMDRPRRSGGIAAC